MKIFEIIKKHKKYLLAILLILTAALAFYVYKLFSYTYLNIKFVELRPLHAHMPVYYKGLIVGRTIHMKHCDRYKATLIKVVLYPQNLMLPENTTAMLKKEKREKKERDFIELIYPEHPMSIMLSDGATIKGKATVDIDTFMANSDPDKLEQIRDDIADILNNLNASTKSLNTLIESLQQTVNENRPYLLQASRNLALTTNNISQVSTKVNNSIEQKQLDESISNLNTSLSNLNAASKNIEVITTNVDGVTKSFSVTTMAGVDSSITQVSSILKNLNEITCGISNTMKKRFAGMRLLFGTPIDSSCTNDSCNCSKSSEQTP